MYPLFHTDNLGGGGNRTFYQNARVDSLIEAAQRSDDRAGAALYSRIDSLVYAAAFAGLDLSVSGADGRGC